MNTYHGSAYEYYLDNNRLSLYVGQQSYGYARLPTGTAAGSERASAESCCRNYWVARLIPLRMTRVTGGPIRVFETIVPWATMRQGQLIFGGITNVIGTRTPIAPRLTDSLPMLLRQQIRAGSA